MKRSSFRQEMPAICAHGDEEIRMQALRVQTLSRRFAIGLPWPRSVSPRGSPRDTESRSCRGHFHYLGCGRQSEMERCTPSVVRRGPQTATMGLDDGTADG